MSQGQVDCSWSGWLCIFIWLVRARVRIRIALFTVPHHSLATLLATGRFARLLCLPSSWASPLVIPFPLGIPHYGNSAQMTFTWNPLTSISRRSNASCFLGSRSRLYPYSSLYGLMQVDKWTRSDLYTAYPQLPYIVKYTN